jgi:hypothetical protein
MIPLCSDRCSQPTEVAKVADVFGCSWQAEQERYDQANNTEDDRTSTITGHCIHRDPECQDMHAHDKCQDQFLSNSKHLTTKWSIDKHTAVSVASYGRMGQLQFTNHMACVCSNDTQEAYAKEARDETEDCEGLWKGKDA